MGKANLTFAIELEIGPLVALFEDPAVIQHLLDLEAGVSLGLIDLSPERAGVVRQLNQAGVPVIAWLLLPKEDGYWFNAYNLPQATAFYEAFLAWSEAFDLTWAAVGLDVEPDFWEMQQLIEGRLWRVLPRMISRLFDGGFLRRSQAAYGGLVARIHAAGWPVESYHFPFIVDERRAGSTLLQRLFGLVDLPADREGLMLYSSFLPVLGPALLCSYAPEADVIAVGSTGGGVETDVEFRVLSWEELARDLRLAKQWKDEIFIFSLEGCYRQGYLERLKQFEWTQPVPVPGQTIRQVDTARRAFRAVLWLGSRPWVLLLALVGLIFLGSRLRRALTVSTRRR